MGVSFVLGFLGLGVLILLVSSCKGEVYKVGESNGWTSVGHVNYKIWAASKIFQIGDVIVFNYSPQFHNVMQVTDSAYKACNATFPISTYWSGYDSITITSQGHHFFLCGTPGHCQNGQKVDINVSFSPPSPAPSPTPPLASKGASSQTYRLISSIYALSAMLLLLLA